MKRIIFPVLITLLFFSCGEKKTIEPQELAQKIYEKYSGKQYMHYKLDLKYNNEGQPDTIPTPYEVWLVRDKNDKDFGGLVWIENYYRPYTIYYDLKDVYILYPTKHKIRQYADKSLFHPMITYGDWVDVFLHPDHLMKEIANKTAKLSVVDTLIGKKHFWKLTIDKPKPNSEMKRVTVNLVIDKKSYNPVEAYIRSEYKSDVRNEWLKFVDVDFNSIDTSRFRSKFDSLASLYPPIPYDPSKPEQLIELMLPVGQPAPDVTGENYLTGEKFNLSDYKGKVVILDFWYSHCPPCVRAIPKLSELYEEYHDKGLEVFGLNSIDNKPGDKQNTEVFYAFLKHVGIKYPPIRTESSVDRAYKIIAYPSIYILDRDGKVAFIEVGFGKDSYDKIKAKVEELLSE